ncbi:UNVERIFIED_CONTAM: deoxyribonuclease-4 [Brevibacillus sp. OAP136]
MKIGSHVSTRNGYFGAAQQTVRLGGKAFQYFPKNPRSLTVKSFDHQDANNCARFCQEHGLVSIAHTAYPTNLSEADDAMRRVMMASIANDLEIAEACGSIGVVVHFGKYKGADPLMGYTLMINMLNQILRDWEGSALVLIENNAGQGAKMGITFEELVQIRKLSAYPEKIGFCLDTCHAFASGLWNGSNWPALVEKGTELGYFPHLKAVHLNDSMHESSSYRDRHANVGKGYIGEASMRGFLQSPVIREMPVILETPSSASYTHQVEIAYVHSLAEVNEGNAKKGRQRQ